MKKEKTDEGIKQKKEKKERDGTWGWNIFMILFCTALLLALLETFDLINLFPNW